MYKPLSNKKWKQTSGEVWKEMSIHYNENNKFITFYLFLLKHPDF